MNWIKVQTNLRTSPKVIRVASSLEWTPVQSLGAIVTAWMLADEHATDSGLLEGLSFEDLDAMVSCPGLAQAMEKVGWLKQSKKGVQFVDYEDHNGSTAKSRASAQRRQSRKRHAPVTVKRDTGVTREEKNREEKNINNNNNNNNIIIDEPEEVEVVVEEEAGDKEKTKAAEFVNKTAQKLAQAYDSKPEWIGTESKRQAYVLQRQNNFTDEDVDLCVRFIKAHRAGKLGKNEPRIAQDAESALSGISKLIQRSAAFKTKLKPKRFPEEKKFKPLISKDPTPEELAQIKADLEKAKKEILNQVKT
tara:strand:- start:334 stop:1248 length:915 start_codon:yes stop_codon:yes gene_type:complete